MHWNEKATYRDIGHVVCFSNCVPPTRGNRNFHFHRRRKIMAQGTRKLRLESLEHKKMLAGDVFVSFAQGTLQIEGDELANQVAISSGETPGSYVITGLQDTSVTLVDGDGNPVDPPADAAENVVVVEGVRRGIRANMGDGDDVVNVNDLRTRSNVSIRTGEGDDVVRVGVRPEVTDGETDETAPIAEPDVVIGGSLRIGTAAGEDRVVINHTNVGRALSVATGTEDDTVRIGRGEPAEADSADEAPPATADVRAGRTHIHLGQGDDSARIQDLHTRNLGVRGGQGDDAIGIEGVRARGIHVHGGRGAGADTVVIRDSVTSSLFAALGDGDDTLTMGGVKARLALLFGGQGEADTLNDLGDNMIRHQRAIGFELPADEEQAPSVGG
jgi:hypothetical protein